MQSGSNAYSIQVFGGCLGVVSTTPSAILSPADLTLPGSRLSELGTMSLALGDFNGDGFDDLAAGDSRGQPIGNPCAEEDCPGVMLVIPGSAAGLHPQARRQWNQGSTGVPGSESPEMTSAGRRSRATSTPMVGTTW